MKKDHGETFLLTCDSCRKKARMRLVEKTSGSSQPTYFWVCPLCNSETELTQKQFEDIRRTIQTFENLEKELSSVRR